jgi:ferritin-like metal-binding protein YciE
VYHTAKITPTDEDCIPVKAIFKETFALERKGIGMELLGDMDIMLYMQLIEHINITAYRMLLILSKALNLTDVEQLLVESFDESIDDDRLFMLITNEYLSIQEQK